MAIKILIGGSPCTHWSIAQKNNRETEPEGIGWELFKNYLIAKEKFKPDYFLYENNKSAAQPIKDQISRELDVDLMYINSALVSAQNRQRFYAFNWEVDQPEDRGIILKDILESGECWREKSLCLDANYFKGGNFTNLNKQSGQRLMVAEPIRIPEYGAEDKARPLNAHYSNNCGGFEHRMFSDNPNKQQVDMIAEPVNVDKDGKARTLKAQYYKNGMANFVTNGGFGASAVAEPIRVGDLPNAKGEISGSQATRIYSTEGKSVNLVANGGGQGAKTGLYAVPYELSDEYYKGGEDSNLIGMTVNGEGKYRNGNQPSQQYRVYSCEDKSQVVNTMANENYIVPYDCDESNIGECAMFSPPHGWNEGQITYDKSPTITTGSSTRQQNVLIQDATSAQGIIEGEKPKAFINKVYEVKDGLITIKGKQYPIKLPDGFYIIRKLTVTECCRLQTLPDDYCKAVSNSQAYKGLGNGWTAEVIIHILNGILKDVPRDEEIIVLSMYDGIGTGRYCLDKMGFTNVKYYAYEIDPYPIKIAMDNYPDIIQCGDAFAVREDDWKPPQTRSEWLDDLLAD